MATTATKRTARAEYEAARREWEEAANWYLYGSHTPETKAAAKRHKDAAYERMMAASDKA